MAKTIIGHTYRMQHEYGGKAFGDGIGVHSGLLERVLYGLVKVVAQSGVRACRRFVVREPECTALISRPIYRTRTMGNKAVGLST